MKYIYFLVIGFFFVQCSGNQTGEKKKKNAEEVKKIEIKVSNVKFEDQEDGTWVMTGFIKNVNDFEIQGDADVVLLDKNKKRVSEFTTALNEGNPIAPGDSVQFSHQADQGQFAGATGYQVQFVNE